MVLTHLGKKFDYLQLLQLLEIKPHGAPARNIRQLTALNLSVTYSQTDLDSLEAVLQQGHPVIVFVRTSELPHWTYATDHALLLVGYDEEQVYVNDPGHDEAPIAVPRGDFELAWLEKDYYYALITS
jgi:uncharacterized protein YvpB